MVEVLCPFCNHIQQTKSKLKNVTCSSCRKKFPNPSINNSGPDKKNLSVPETATEDPRISETEKEKDLSLMEKGEAKKLKLD